MEGTISLNEFNDRLAQLSKMNFTKALNRACLVIENEAKRECPVDTGMLRDSITHRVENGNTGIVGTNVEYAPYVEYGTGEFATQGGGRQGGWVYYSEKDDTFYWTTGRKAQPFLMPAFENHKDDVMRELADAIKKEFYNG